MAEDQCAVKSDRYDGGQSGEPMPEVTLGRVVGHDSNRVIENSNNHRIGILSNGGTDANDRPGQSAGVRQSLP